VGSEADKELENSTNLPSPLRPYQWDGVNFLVDRKAALLADEMGLGKTVQAAVALRLSMVKHKYRRALIISPATLVMNWERELAKWSKELTVRRVIGNARDRLATYQLPIPVLIASYEQIRADAVKIATNIKFDIVILDEAQRIKNRNSRTNLACRLLQRKHSWVLTGTPIENSLEDLLSIFLFLNPNLLHSGMRPIEIHANVRNYFLRRRKEEVLAELPPKIIQEIPLELSTDQEEEYSNLWLQREEYLSSEMSLLALITKLKQVCNFHPTTRQSTKCEMLKIILSDLTKQDDKVIIFSQYVDSLYKISDQIKDFPHGFYHGGQSQEQKDENLKQFESESGPRALLISLMAGGVGLNIHTASTVVLFDRWWNPALEAQAINRAHRFGRDKPLHVLKFLVLDTIEEKIKALLESKSITFNEYIEKASNAELKFYTRDDLLRLLEIPTAKKTITHISNRSKPFTGGQNENS